MLDTIAHTARVLGCFTRDRPTWGVRALAAHLGLPKSTVHSYLSSLQHVGFLRHTASGKYALSWRMLEFAEVLGADVSWLARGKTAMHTLAKHLGAMTYLAVQEGQEVICIARDHHEPSTHPEIATDLYLPVHATAAGKVFAAFCHIKPKSWHSYTENTITTPDEWNTMVHKVQKDGFAESIEEWVQGSCAVCAPIWENEQVVAVLGVQLKTERYTKNMSRVRQALLGCCG